MSKISIITRSDDLGSSVSANEGIKSVCDAGFFKNVSVMAPGPYIEHAAKLLAHRTDICFGMHITINAEWDKVKWKPVSNVGQDCGLIDENGYFLNSPQLFRETKPSVDVIMNEIDAQYNRLIKLGFDIKYIDSHMMSEFCVPGMDDAVKDFANEKGLIDHMYFYHDPLGFYEACNKPDTLPDYIKSLPDDQYLIVMHPALYGEDMLLTGTADIPGKQIAEERSAEAKLFSNPELIKTLSSCGFKSIRYDEAKLQKRMII